MYERKYKLTNPQKNMYSLEKFYANTNVTNLVSTLEVNAILDFGYFEQAINKVIQNNNSFRLHFIEENGEIQQYISEYQYCKMQVIEIQNENELNNAIQEIGKKLFNLNTSENLFEFTLYKYPNNKGGLILRISHLLTDSWALGIIAKQIMQQYNILIGDKSALATQNENNEEHHSYVEFIQDEEEYFNSEKAQKDEEYWNTTFETMPENAILPSVKNEITNKLNCEAQRNTYIFSKEEMNEINEFCQQNKTSLFNFFMSVYSIYIGKSCNISDFVMGTPILNRSNFAQKNTTGLFISTVPIRINMQQENISFAEHTKNIAVNLVSILRHQKYPYQKIIENLRKKQSNSANLYNILLSYQITKTNTEGYDYETKWHFINSCPDSLQIHIFDLNSVGSFNICYDYQTQKYTSKEIDKLHERIKYIIKQVLKNNEINISDLEITTPDEKFLVFEKFNNTALKYDETKNVVNLFEENVLKTPEKIALKCNGQQLTYEELNTKVNQCAHYLKQNGIEKHDLVGIMTTRSFEMVIGLLATLKIGAAYVPIDHTYPEERIQYIAENSKVKTLLVDNTTITKINNIHKLNISLNTSIYQNENTKNLGTQIEPEDLMYMIYTSGSTGNPKGVLLTHKNFTNFIYGMKERIHLNEYQNILCITTICFDIFGLELWGGLVNGLTVVLANDTEHNNVEKLNKLCIDNNVEIMQTTPSRMMAILNEKNHNEFIKNLHIIMIGGEQLNSIIIDRLSNMQNCKIYNMYGPTETTVWSTIKKIVDSNDITIGTPIANTTCYILNNNLKLLPPYYPGILYIGGDGVSKGYKELSKLTFEKFIHSPYNQNEIIYNTGDYAYYDEFGEIHHLGRKDFQIKVRGYRVELAEIENQILNFDNIIEAVVVANEKYLICYYTSNKNIKEVDLISYLLNKLPEYMIPSRFIKLDEMPHTPNGKLDRKKLPNVLDELESEAPQTETEIKIAKIVGKITNNEVEDINASFISLGLDSLGIIKAQTELLSAGINLTTHDFYKYQTIKKLAEKIDNNIEQYNDSASEVPENLKHYKDELISKISTVNVNENDLGTVLLTGANGFIGIHILNEILQTTENTVYCLVRGETEEIRRNKLEEAYNYYFKTSLENIINSRIFIIAGDSKYENLNIADEDLEQIQKNVKTIINTAAVVKHYGNIEEFIQNNINGTRNVVKLAYENNKKLIHLSSLSVSGNYLVKQDNRDVTFSENDLYIGQHYTENNYVYSKFESEKVIYEYMEKGLTAQIHRVGIVSGRYSDGVFQQKINENAFYKRIKSIVDIHAISKTMMLQKIEFTPVDLCAKSIVTLAKNSICNNKIFHIYNHNLITIFKLVEVMKEIGINVDIMEIQQFNDYILEISKDGNDKLSGLINDFGYTENHLLNINYNFTVNIESDYTRNYLHLLGFDWPITDDSYILKVLQYMKDVKFI